MRIDSRYTKKNEKILGGYLIWSTTLALMFPKPTYSFLISFPASTTVRTLPFNTDSVLFGKEILPLSDDDVLPDSAFLQSNFDIETDTNEASQEYDQHDDDMDFFRFSSIDELYSPSHPQEDVLKILEASKVAIVGLGGIGSWAAEALCRSGVGHFVLIDLEDICVSQTTTGLNSLKSNIGKFKTEIMRERLLQIHPSVSVDIVNDFVMDDNVESIVTKQLEGVKVAIDCIDGASEKMRFWKVCQDNGISPLTTGSPSGKLDPTKVVCRPLEDISDHPYTDETLLACANELADKSENEKKKMGSIRCIFSEEDSVQSSFGTAAGGRVCMVSGSMGFVAASQAISLILDHEETKLVK